MEMLASDVAAATGGVLVGPDVVVDGAAFDSRGVRRGNLFVPIVADRDGHDFVDAAVDAGAAAYLSSREVDPSTLAEGCSAIVVVDTAEALLHLASWARTRLDVPVVGITGSVGKTSTKDLTAAALSASGPVSASERSFNNEQGLPVTVLGVHADARAVVLEMGMRGFGQITRLCEVADPTVGVVTAVAEAHTELLGGIDAVAVAKRELVEWLPSSGTAVLNADDRRVAAMAAHANAEVITFGVSGDVRWSEVVVDDLARASFRIDSPWGSAQVRLPVSGEHMISNAAAALTVAGVIEGRIEPAAEAVATATVSRMRMEVHTRPDGAIVVDDAYNANPESMRAALDAVAAMRADRRVAVLGAMAELGDVDDGHRRVAEHARSLGVEVIAVGTDLYGTEPVDDITAALGRLGRGDVVLVKASRAAGLEKVVAELLR